MIAKIASALLVSGVLFFNVSQASAADYSFTALGLGWSELDWCNCASS